MISTDSPERVSGCTTYTAGRRRTRCRPPPRRRRSLDQSCRPRARSRPSAPSLSQPCERSSRSRSSPASNCSASASPAFAAASLRWVRSSSASRSPPTSVISSWTIAAWSASVAPPVRRAHRGGGLGVCVAGVRLALEHHERDHALRRGARVQDGAGLGDLADGVEQRRRVLDAAEAQEERGVVERRARRRRPRRR